MITSMDDDDDDDDDDGGFGRRTELCERLLGEEAEAGSANGSVWSHEAMAAETSAELIFITQSADKFTARLQKPWTGRTFLF
jgi:hypothetical protein